MSALSANLEPSLDLLADIVQRPDFAQAELDRVRTQTLTGDRAGPEGAQLDGRARASGAALRRRPSLCDDSAGRSSRRSPRSAATIWSASSDSWLRPDNLEIFVVSNLPLAELTAAARGAVRQMGGARRGQGRQEFHARRRPRPTKPRIVLIDRPGSPQSIILGGQMTADRSARRHHRGERANEVLGGNFLSRINMDLRETKGWSYGVRGSVDLTRNAVALHRQRAGPGRPHRRFDHRAERADQPLPRQEGRDRGGIARATVANNVQALPGRFETSSAVLGGDDDQRSLRPAGQLLRAAGGRYRGLTRPASTRRCARRSIPRGSSGWWSATPPR